jgi:hypothetical protein
MNRISCMALGGMLLSGMLLAAVPAAADELKEIGCGRTLEKDGAPPQLMMDKSLHVLDQTAGSAKFDPGPAPAGYRIGAIFCARSDVVPGPHDYKVVAAGYPLTLFARDAGGQTRIAILETDGGQLRLRSVGQAGFTPDMIQRIQAVLDSSIPQFKAATR